ncbi:MAG: DUF3786 domain-containing protein [Lachnospiraceae bacterium]|jgi:hypothetical protein|nr:DUF3786 domain-containing protein [Lachnospiraceae bacterium]
MGKQPEFQGNYERVLDEWREKSRTWDLRKKWGELGLPEYAGENPRLACYGVMYEWNPRDGRIYEAGHPEREAQFTTAMNIYSLLYYSRTAPALSGIWVPLREVKRAYPFAAAFQNRALGPFARCFDGRKEALIRAGEQLGFRRIPFSDAGFEAMAFPCLPVRFLFWDGDEEFPAQANILFDSNITDFVHEETVVMLGEDGVRRLMEAV